MILPRTEVFSSYYSTLIIGTNYALTIIKKEEQMIALTRNEIVDELIKLGIISPAEVQDYSMEYMIYYQVNCLKLN